MRIKKVLLYILAAAVALSFSGGGTDRAWADETAFLNNAPDPPSPDTEEQQNVEEQTAIEEKFSTDELPDEILQDVMAAAPETGEVPEETSGEEYSRLLARKNQVYNAGDSKLTIVKETPSDKKDFTLMVYMIGSNLESLRGSASKDILEMLDSGVGYENFNLILYTGGSTRWSSFSGSARCAATSPAATAAATARPSPRPLTCPLRTSCACWTASTAAAPRIPCS